MESKNLSKKDLLCISFKMPEKRSNSSGSFNDYERPGRVAAYCNINYDQVRASISTSRSMEINVFSEEGYYNQLPPMGQIEIRFNFYQK